MACEREWDVDGWWCVGDETGCLYNRNKECIHPGVSLAPLEEPHDVTLIPEHGEVNDGR